MFWSTYKPDSFSWSLAYKIRIPHASIKEGFVRAFLERPNSRAGGGGLPPAYKSAKKWAGFSRNLYNYVQRNIQRWKSLLPRLRATNHLPGKSPAAVFWRGIPHLMDRLVHRAAAAQQRPGRRCILHPIRRLRACVGGNAGGRPGQSTAHPRPVGRRLLAGALALVVAVYVNWLLFAHLLDSGAGPSTGGWRLSPPDARAGFFSTPMPVYPACARCSIP